MLNDLENVHVLLLEHKAVRAADAAFAIQQCASANVEVQRTIEAIIATGETEITTTTTTTTNSHDSNPTQTRQRHRESVSELRILSLCVIIFLCRCLGFLYCVTFGFMLITQAYKTYFH